jgi:hypothetical protein
MGTWSFVSQKKVGVDFTDVQITLVATIQSQWMGEEGGKGDGGSYTYG